MIFFESVGVKWNVDKPGLERMRLEAKGTTSKERCMRKVVYIELSYLAGE